MNCPHCGDEACELGYACPKNANRERAADGDYVMQSFIKEALEDDTAAARRIVIVPAPGDICGGSGKLPRARGEVFAKKCPGCRACR